MRRENNRLWLLNMPDLVNGFGFYKKWLLNAYESKAYIVQAASKCQAHTSVKILMFQNIAATKEVCFSYTNTPQHNKNNINIPTSYASNIKMHSRIFF